DKARVVFDRRDGGRSAGVASAAGSRRYAERGELQRDGSAAVGGHDHLRVVIAVGMDAEHMFRRELVGGDGGFGIPGEQLNEYRRDGAELVNGPGIINAHSGRIALRRDGGSVPEDVSARGSGASGFEIQGGVGLKLGGLVEVSPEGDGHDEYKNC